MPRGFGLAMMGPVIFSVATGVDWGVDDESEETADAESADAIRKGIEIEVAMAVLRSILCCPVELKMDSADAAEQLMRKITNATATIVAFKFVAPMMFDLLISCNCNIKSFIFRCKR